MINDIKAREILDSRGNPTIEVTIKTTNGDYTSSVPSGASTGKHEAKELRDGEERYNGKGVKKAVDNINNIIAPLFIEKYIDLIEADELMIKKDGTKDKSNLGANAILAVSMSLLRAKAAEKNIPLYEYIAEYFDFNKKIPKPLFNIVNGGAHGKGGVSFQEFMFAPQEETFKANLHSAVNFFYKLKSKIIEKYGDSSVNIGDEGGFVPNIASEEDVLTLLKETEEDAQFLIDVAATEFYNNEVYNLKNKEPLTTEEIIDYYKKITTEFNIIGLEDPLQEDDFISWGKLKQEINNILVVGDDLLVTNTERIKIAEENNSCNAIILKINQIGSISEAVMAVKKAQSLGWKVIVSHRSGETNDDFIADFAVGVGADYIKSGAPQRGERIAKYNRLLKIEECLK